MNETYDNIIPIECVNCLNFLCFFFEYLVLFNTHFIVCPPHRIVAMAIFFRKGEILICKELKVNYPGCQRLL